VNHWCPEVYRSIFVDRFNDDKIKVAPCCQAVSAVESVDGFSFETSTHLSNIRNQFDQKIKAAECERCWQAEELGHKSRRQSAIEFFNVETPDNTVTLESIDYSSTWACNLTCIMCGPHYSSAWATEVDIPHTELFKIGRSFQKNNTFVDKLDLTRIKKIHFNGGEPLLNNDQINLLDSVDLSNTFISYNTNGTTYPSKKLVDLWKQSQLVKLFFSIDGTENSFEYIRYPGKWKTVAENILRMRDQLPSNVMFGFNVTVGCYNVFEIADVWNWFSENLRTNREGDPSDFNWQFAYNYNLKALASTAKQAAIDHLESIEQYRGVADYLKKTINHVPNNSWMDKLNEIDTRRGTNWQHALQVGKYY
jgi:MoaA/NifB/PqqE/SkfB family radical SAM enzyme